MKSRKRIIFACIGFETLSYCLWQQFNINFELKLGWDDKIARVAIHKKVERSIDLYDETE